MSQKRKYANHFEYPAKHIKELGIVMEWVELLRGEYASPDFGPHPNHAPDCVVLDREGRNVAVEVSELVDREIIEKNIAGKAVYKTYEKQEFISCVRKILGRKDAKKYHGRYAKIIILIHTDEPDLSFKRCNRWIRNHEFDGFRKIMEAYMIFSYNPLAEKYQHMKIKISNKTFRDRVLVTVRKIPKGKTLTYKQVAEKAGSPRAYRAVGNILKKNYDPNIPCHRVVRSDGRAGGYNRGAEKKLELLEKEKREKK
jgi:O-6-methylguanine DNA methyltransferase